VDLPIIYRKLLNWPACPESVRETHFWIFRLEHLPHFFLKNKLFPLTGKYYVFTASIRAGLVHRDFGDEHKWGYFPSGAIALALFSDEPFLEEKVKLLVILKTASQLWYTGNNLP